MCWLVLVVLCVERAVEVMVEVWLAEGGMMPPCIIDVPTGTGTGTGGPVVGRAVGVGGSVRSETASEVSHLSVRVVGTLAAHVPEEVRHGAANRLYVVDADRGPAQHLHLVL